MNISKPIFMQPNRRNFR
nr:unnamed protein product [Callosobruchus chinensis]